MIGIIAIVCLSSSISVIVSTTISKLMIDKKDQECKIRQGYNPRRL
jgi:hypothetical protein